MNLKYLADEYNKLTNYIYSFGIDSNEKLDISFNKRGFYHLLGFEKFTDVTVVQMVEYGVLRKEKFFEEIENEHIRYDESDIRNIDTFCNNHIVNFCDAKITDNVQKVLRDRIPFFSYNNIMQLFNSDLIILYDKDKGLEGCKVDADKIFFKLLKPEHKNLYLFIKDNADSPISFFKENKRNVYIKTKSGEHEQKKATIMYKSVWDKKQNVLVDFKIFWDKIRFYYSRNNSINYKAQLNLEKYFNKGTVIYSTNIELEMIKIDYEIEKCKSLIKKNSYILEYLIETDNKKKIETATQLLKKYNFNVKIEKLNIDSKQLQNDTDKLKNKISYYNKKNKRLNKYSAILFELEKEEIIFVYKNYFNKIYDLDDDFFYQLIHTYRIFENIYFPNQIKEFYKKYK